MMNQGIRDAAGIPIAEDFASIDGTPLVVNGATGDLFLFLNGSVKRVASVTSLNFTKFTSINVGAGTLLAGQITGACFVVLMSTNALPGAQTTRTATQMIADMGNAMPGDTYLLRIINTGVGTFTLTAPGGGGVTLNGTMTILVGTWRDFAVTCTSSTTMSFQTVGVGTYL